jgi:hypothetical protein
MDNRDHDAFKKYFTNDEVGLVKDGLVTRYMYLKALEIIDIYHRQNDTSIKTDHLTEITKWEYLNTCSIKLRNALITIMHGIKIYISSYGDINYKESFIENIDVSKMKKMRGVGIGTVKEFIKLRGY